MDMDDRGRLTDHNIFQAILSNIAVLLFHCAVFMFYCMKHC